MITLTLLVSALMIVCADNKGYISDEEWRRTNCEIG